MKKRTIFSLIAVLAFSLTIALTSCEKLEEVVPEAVEESALKGAQAYLFKPKMNLRPTTTMDQSTVDWTPSPDHGNIYGTTWRQPYNFAGYYEGSRIGPWGQSSRNALQIKSNGSAQNQTLFRIEPTLDPIGYDGHVAFMVKGKAGETLRMYTVIATAGEGDVNIFPDSNEEHEYYWAWWQQDGVYRDPTNNITLTGGWQYVQKDVAGDFWQEVSRHPNAGFDKFPPYEDDFYVQFEEMDFTSDEPFYIDFMVNGNTSVPTRSVDNDVTFPSGTIYTGSNYTYTYDGGDFPFHDYEWSVPAGRATIVSGQGTKNVVIRWNSTGWTEFSVRVKLNQMGWSSWETNIEQAFSTQPPQPPSPPTITGASSVGMYAVESYSMPAGKEDYEWTLPYGTAHVQEYNNIKVIRFTSGGAKTIQGKYKENGVWSAVGYKTVNVSYY